MEQPQTGVAGGHGPRFFVGIAFLILALYLGGGWYVANSQRQSQAQRPYPTLTATPPYPTPFLMLEPPG